MVPIVLSERGFSAETHKETTPCSSEEKNISGKDKQQRLRKQISLESMRNWKEVRVVGAYQARDRAGEA